MARVGSLFTDVTRQPKSSFFRSLGYAFRGKRAVPGFSDRLGPMAATDVARQALVKNGQAFAFEPSGTFNHGADGRGLDIRNLRKLALPRGIEPLFQP
jgi:hypothetical protein